MGMFDNVYDGNEPLVMKCPECGEDVTGFQSKSGPCMLENIDWRLLPNFYTECQNCSHWLEINVEPPIFELKMVHAGEVLRAEMVQVSCDEHRVPTLRPFVEGDTSGDLKPD